MSMDIDYKRILEKNVNDIDRLKNDNYKLVNLLANAEETIAELIYEIKELKGGLVEIKARLEGANSEVARLGMEVKHQAKQINQAYSI